MDAPKQPYGSEQRPAWATASPQWSSPAAAPPPAPAGAGRASGRGQTRTALIVLVAVFTEVVIVAAAANQWVSKKIAEDAVGTVSFWRLFERSWLTYTWRVSPQSGASREWGAQLALDVVTFVVSALLITVLVRAAATTFWRVFFATWLSVLAATIVGAFVRGLIWPDVHAGLPTGGRVTRALFGPLGPGQAAVVSAATLGLVAALIVAFVAVLARRPVETGAPGAPADTQYVPPEQPPPYYGEHPSGAPAAPAWQDQPFEPHRRLAPPAFAPPAAGDDQPTTAYRPVSGRPAAQPTVSGDQPTTQFPRPPDEEDLHH